MNINKKALAALAASAAVAIGVGIGFTRGKNASNLRSASASQSQATSDLNVLAGNAIKDNSSKAGKGFSGKANKCYARPCSSVAECCNADQFKCQAGKCCVQNTQTCTNTSQCCNLNKVCRPNGSFSGKSGKSQKECRCARTGHDECTSTLQCCSPDKVCRATGPSGKARKECRCAKNNQACTTDASCCNSNKECRPNGMGQPVCLDRLPSATPSLSPSMEPTASCAVETASFDQTRGAPTCSTIGQECSSGKLLVGRDNLAGGAESNQPNSIDGCAADGTSGVYLGDESVESIKISSVDGECLQAGNMARIETVVWVWGSGSQARIYYTADAANPTWQEISFTQHSVQGYVTITTEHVLPSGPLQAIRVRMGWNMPAGACGGGSWTDTDDIVFAVAPGNNVQSTVIDSAPESLYEPPIIDCELLQDSAEKCNFLDYCAWQQGVNGEGCYNNNS